MNSQVYNLNTLYFQHAIEIKLNEICNYNKKYYVSLRLQIIYGKYNTGVNVS